MTDLRGEATAQDAAGTAGTLDAAGTAGTLDVAGTAGTLDAAGTAGTLDAAGTAGTLDAAGTAGAQRAASTAGAGGGDADEVDELVAGWRAERPDLDVQPLHVLSRVFRLARHLDRARRAAFAAHGLETWEFDVLSALRRQGPPYRLSPGALLHATLVTSGTMTNRIDRLEQAGLVSRHPDERDKRGVLVSLTARGRAVADAALSDLLVRERELLSRLGPAEQEQLAALLRVLLAPLDAGDRPLGGS